MRRIVLVCAIFCVFLGGEAMAGRPGWFFPLNNHHHGHRVQRRAPTYAETYRSLNARYPKYTGAFHANYFRDLGVPPGDIGIRGNSLFPSPW